MNIQLIKRIVLVYILIIIVLGSHILKGDLYTILNNIGLNISMTPFTADMVFMDTLNKKIEPHYMSDIIIKIQDKNGMVYSKNISELGFYEFKAPFQWWIECKQANGQCPRVLEFMCQSLSFHFDKKIDTWEATLSKQFNKQERPGFGIHNICQM